MGKLLKKKWKSNAKTILASLFLLALMFFWGFSEGHEWSYRDDTHCCRHMSQNIEEKLEAYGFDVKIILGDPLKGSAGHMWVNVNGIDIDSVCLLPFISQFLFPANRTVFDSYQDYLSTLKVVKNGG